MNDYLEILFTLIQNTAFQAGLFVVGSLVVAKIVDWIITSVLSRLASRTDSTIDDRIIQILHRPIYYSILFMGLGISIQLFQLPELRVSASQSWRHRFPIHFFQNPYQNSGKDFEKNV